MAAPLSGWGLLVACTQRGSTHLRRYPKRRRLICAGVLTRSSSMRSVPEGFSRHGKPSNLSLPAAPGSREPSIHAALIVAQGVGHPRLAVAAASKRENWRAFCISRLSRARHRRAAIAVFARKPARPCFAFWQPTRRAPRCT